MSVRNAADAPLPGVKTVDRPAGWAVLGVLALSALAGLALASLVEERDSDRIGGVSAEFRLRLDVNRATARELELLPGIGPSRAMRIVRARGERGGFRSLRELDDDSLLGPGASERLAPYLLPLGPDRKGS